MSACLLTSAVRIICKVRKMAPCYTKLDMILETTLVCSQLYSDRGRSKQDPP